MCGVNAENTSVIHRPLFAKRTRSNIISVSVNILQHVCQFLFRPDVETAPLQQTQTTTGRLVMPSSTMPFTLPPPTLCHAMCASVQRALVILCSLFQTPNGITWFSQLLPCRCVRGLPPRVLVALFPHACRRRRWAKRKKAHALFL